LMDPSIAVRSRYASIAGDVGSVLAGPGVDPAGLEKSVLDEVRKITSDLDAVDAVFESALEGATDDLARKWKESEAIGRSLSSLAETRVADFERLGGQAEKLQMLLRDPEVVMGGGARVAVEAQLKNMTDNLTDGLVKSLSLDALKGISDLPASIKSQVEGILAPFSKENIQTSITEAVGGGGSTMATAGLTVAAAAFTEMRAASRHKEVMGMLRAMSIKLDTIISKLDDLIKQGKEIHEEVLAARKDIAKLHESQDEGFRRVMYALNDIEQGLVSAALAPYCTCTLFVPEPTTELWETGLTLNRLAGVTPTLSCLREARDTNSGLFETCRKHVRFPATPGSNFWALSIARADPSPTIASSRLAIEHRSAAAGFVDSLVNCAPPGVVSLRSPASAPAASIATATLQAGALTNGRSPREVLTCMEGNAFPPASFFVAGKHALHPPLVLMHAYMAGNLHVYSHLNPATLGVDRGIAIDSLEAALSMLDGIGRSLTLESGGFLLPLTVQALDAAPLYSDRPCDPSVPPCKPTAIDALLAPADSELVTPRKVAVTQGPAEKKAVAEVQVLAANYSENLGLALVDARYGANAIAQAQYALAVGGAGCRACLDAALGRAWKVVHSDEDDVCQVLVNRRSDPPPPPDAHGWCAKTAFSIGKGTANYLQFLTGTAPRPRRLVVVPLPRPADLRAGHLSRSVASDAVSEMARWLYAELLELSAIKNAQATAGLLPAGFVSSAGSVGGCNGGKETGSSQMEVVPDHYIRALERIGFYREALTCGAIPAIPAGISEP